MLEKIKNVNKKWREFVITVSIILACLLAYSLMPTQDFAQKITKSFFFLFLIPFFHIRYILKKNLKDFSFNFKNKKRGFFLAGIATIISLILIYILITYTDFESKYILPIGLTKSFLFFLIYKLILINIPLFFQEFFFKGFLLTVLKEKWDYFSVPIQAIIYLTPLFIISNNYWNLIPVIIISVFGGIAAYLSKSFVYSYLFAILFLILADAMVIALAR